MPPVCKPKLKRKLDRFARNAERICEFLGLSYAPVSWPLQVLRTDIHSGHLHGGKYHGLCHVPV